MSTAAIEARTLTLVRLERAAGAAFGYEDDTSCNARPVFVTPTTVVLATLVTAFAATITYLV